MCETHCVRIVHGRFRNKNCERHQIHKLLHSPTVALAINNDSPLTLPSLAAMNAWMYMLKWIDNFQQNVSNEKRKLVAMETEHSTECLLRDQISYMSESRSCEYSLLWKQIDEKSWLPREKKYNAYQWLLQIASDQNCFCSHKVVSTLIVITIKTKSCAVSFLFIHNWNRPRMFIVQNTGCYGDKAGKYWLPWR